MIKEYQSLLVKNPRLALEWHPNKNTPITPNDVSAGSNIYVWWLCENGHEWKAMINSRNAGRGCPICIGRFQEPLSKTHPELASEWHPKMNSELTPGSVTAGSSKKIYWLCNKCDYTWQSTIANRKNGNGCPKCAGKVVTDENCLAYVNPSVLSEWHPSRNKDITPYKIHAYSDKKVWWLCKECSREWRATPNHRTRMKTGCPSCKERHNVSFDELAFVYFYKQVFLDVKFNYEVEAGDKRYKVDLFVPKYNLILEYDSEFFHRHRIQSDIEKSIQLLRNNYLLIRMRENGLPEIITHGINIVPFQNKNKEQLQSAIIDSFGYIKDKVQLTQDELNRMEETVQTVDIEKQRFNILKQVPPIEQKNNIKEFSDTLAVQFDLDKNFPFRPEHFSNGSKFKVWWMCEHGHCWEAAPSTRKKGNGCPFCAGQKVTRETSLGSVREDLAKEWDYDKNYGITPFDIPPNSNKKFWWLCSKGHSYESSTDHRNNRGDGCPYCGGKKVNNDNCLATVNPSLASQWHPTKNEILTPYDVTPGSQKKVWWKCEKGHEWEAVVYSRNGSKSNKPKGCKKCYEIGRSKKL
ncbi:zinc-ribbon domain-containing protein [Neobacillus sp. YX16]|uniref:zinc-ribbon domain-containing protein n=1 Tax=Neobacillus sp. YX16 TaxID=3047874 RepID=UPI0024C3E455|nr:zinc-ribbon domain-containing protein [Neobacillus sp. YX16]WHZ04949.1 zinc-ribbon domain-containing protein [Neobacillus sp. YX16]